MPAVQVYARSHNGLPVLASKFSAKPLLAHRWQKRSARSLAAGAWPHSVSPSQISRTGGAQMGPNAAGRQQAKATGPLRRSA